MGTAQSVGRRDSYADTGAGGEDLISALPDDVLVHILLQLRDAAAAARTSILARRWRGLWALLPQLTFADGIEHHRIVSALAAHQVPDLRGLRVATRHASVEYLAVWLPIVARRLTGSMLLRVVWHDNEEVAELEPEQRGEILLPCFQRATTVILEFSFLRLVLPPSGVFARLKVLELVGIHLYGQCSLGNALSSPRCPSLQILSVQNARGLGNFTIHSKSLLELKLLKLPDMQQLIVGAPSLQMLIIMGCFTDGLNPSQPVANISAPRLELLLWTCDFVPSSLQLGEMAHLQCLDTGNFFVYGPISFALQNRCCMSILQHFERLSVLNLYIIYPPVIGNIEYLMEDMTSLPDVTILNLDVTAYVHSFGASVFHVLRMCPRLKALCLKFPVKPSQLEVMQSLIFFV
ncbi:putative F-box/FBD/LRR-repeat protein At3g49030 [Triticum dicoccoides]|uniref:putative F-box/FBD/LRR-repeat protein At3g49030 n=1 Tax=Triticum dicoccoides TaxID=85692 RepID=UPI001891DFE2|nr:putative F-box/FBD/LRR-repeat protein At3g49030 [Triticum dicoccoides]